MLLNTHLVYFPPIQRRCKHSTLPLPHGALSHGTSKASRGGSWKTGLDMLSPLKTEEAGHEGPSGTMCDTNADNCLPAVSVPPSYFGPIFSGANDDFFSPLPTKPASYEPVPRTAAVAALRDATEDVAKSYKPPSSAREGAPRARGIESDEPTDNARASASHPRQPIVRGEFLSKAQDAAQSERSATHNARHEHQSDQSTPLSPKSRGKAQLTPSTLPPTVTPGSHRQADLEKKASPASLDALRRGGISASVMAQKGDSTPSPAYEGMATKGSHETLMSTSGLHVRRPLHLSRRT
jgi:hypothetical protein